MEDNDKQATKNVGFPKLNKKGNMVIGFHVQNLTDMTKSLDARGWVNIEIQKRTDSDTYYSFIQTKN